MINTHLFHLSRREKTKIVQSFCDLVTNLSTDEIHFGAMIAEDADYTDGRKTLTTVIEVCNVFQLSLRKLLSARKKFFSEAFIREGEYEGVCDTMDAFVHKCETLLEIYEGQWYLKRYEKAEPPIVDACTRGEYVSGISRVY